MLREIQPWFVVGLTYISFIDNKFTFACRFWSLLFVQEINVKEETFGISSSSTSRENHEARNKFTCECGIWSLLFT
jgi:hypothetical protein